MEDQEADEPLLSEGERGESEQRHTVPVDVSFERLEVDPAEHQWKGDGAAYQASPHQEPVGRAAQEPPAEDEAVRRELEEESACELGNVAADMAGGEEDLPSAAPVHPRGRP